MTAGLWQRSCDGCNARLGDATEAETLASMLGGELPSVTAECPTCRPHVHNPQTTPDGPVCSCGHRGMQ